MMAANKASVAALNIFFKCFVIFTIAMWLSVSWPPDLVMVPAAVIFGVIVASILTIQHVRRVRRLGIEPGLWGSVRHNRTVALSLSCEEAIRLVDWAARSWRWKVRRVDAGRPKITAVTRMSLQSWGERVTVTARPMGAGCEVEVSSRPLVPLTLVDYGRNFINMQHMIAFLTERATEKSQSRETPQTEPGL